MVAQAIGAVVVVQGKIDMQSSGAGKFWPGKLRLTLRVHCQTAAHFSARLPPAFKHLVRFSTP